MSEQYFSQAGMEAACKSFNNAVAAQAGSDDSNFNTWLGCKYQSCDYASRTLRFTVDVSANMRNHANIMHGGAVAGALDFAMGSVCHYYAQRMMLPTISMTLDFLRPIPIGAKLIVEVRCLSCGKTMAHAEAKAWLEGLDEKIVCTASGVYYTGGRKDSANA